ncbi:MAG: glucose-6-phosphate isomerase [Ilumatobacteraceae bacterium]
MNDLETTAQWQRLFALARPGSTAAGIDLGCVFQVGDLLIDASRQVVDADVLDALMDLARERDVAGQWQEMRAGAPINTSEGRAVGHLALRCTEDESFVIDGVDVVPEVRATLRRMEDLAEGIRGGVVTGAGGRPFAHIVNIGIGGSDLGPSLMYEALRPFRAEGISCHFVSNVDPSDSTDHLRGLDPSQTLVIVSSKTFRTAETLANATVVRNWLRTGVGEDDARSRMWAVTADRPAAVSLGIPETQIFPMWNWVGGRFSLGSAVGLSAMIAVGPTAFRRFLDGQRLMDLHAGETFDRRNAALVLTLIGIWNRCVLGFPTKAVLPYSYDLRGLPAYLQQLVMESNGKGVRRNGSSVPCSPSSVIWGGPGTDAQHAFMQFLHQSPDVVPADFIGFGQSLDGDQERQTILFSNMVAQAEALAHGRVDADAPHRSFPGNRPSTVIAAPTLTPSVLGQIIALYEHMVFFEGAILGTNSFDQWGVELGKDLARALGSPSDRAAAPTANLLMEWLSQQSKAVDGDSRSAQAGS